MNATVSFFKRFFSDIPVFERTAQVLSLILLAYLQHIKTQQGISPELITGLSGLAIGIAFFSQFAQKDIAAVAAAPDILSGIADLIPHLLNQVEGIKDTLAAQPTTTDVATLISYVAQTVPAPAPAAIVDLNSNQEASAASDANTGPKLSLV
jgi:hypothetical protein